mmetsp:Transcript_2128/g.4991  ORF Transcript_2128/g.4991 Transcript_2128/m.4991 type:complete len:289 (-) Transcript_2128:204-1070(-)
MTAELTDGLGHCESLAHVHLLLSDPLQDVEDVTSHRCLCCALVLLGQIQVLLGQIQCTWWVGFEDSRIAQEPTRGHTTIHSSQAQCRLNVFVGVYTTVHKHGNANCFSNLANQSPIRRHFVVPLLCSSSTVNAEQLTAGPLQHLCVGDGGLFSLIQDADLAGDRNVQVVVQHAHHIKHQLRFFVEEGTVEATACDPLWTAQVQIDRFTKMLHGESCAQKVARVVATELNEQRMIGWTRVPVHLTIPSVVLPQIRVDHGCVHKIGTVPKYKQTEGQLGELHHRSGDVFR